MWAEIIGAGLNLIGAQSAASATARIAKLQWERAQKGAKLITEPGQAYSKVGTDTLPAITDFVMSKLVPGADQPDAFLGAQHELNLSNINSSRDGAVREVQRYWGMTGNLGRSRGEQERARAVADRSLNAENLDYGTKQLAAIDAKKQTAMGGLQSLINIGESGNQTLTNAAQILAGSAASTAQTSLAGATAPGNALSGVGGLIYGLGASQTALDKQLNLINATRKADGKSPIVI